MFTTIIAIAIAALFVATIAVLSATPDARAFDAMDAESGYELRLHRTMAALPDDATVIARQVAEDLASGLARVERRSPPRFGLAADAERIAREAVVEPSIGRISPVNRAA